MSILYSAVEERMDLVYKMHQKVEDKYAGIVIILLDIKRNCWIFILTGTRKGKIVQN